MAGVNPSIGAFRNLATQMSQADIARSAQHLPAEAGKQVKLGASLAEPVAVSHRTLGRSFVTLLKKTFHVSDPATRAFKDAVRGAVGNQMAQQIFDQAGIKSYKPLSQRKLELALGQLDFLRNAGKFDDALHHQGELGTNALRSTLGSLQNDCLHDGEPVQLTSGQSVTVSNTFVRDAPRSVFVLGSQNYDVGTPAATVTEGLYQATNSDAEHTEALARLLNQGVTSVVQNELGLGLVGNGTTTYQLTRGEPGYDVQVGYRGDLSLVMLPGQDARHGGEPRMADSENSSFDVDVSFHVPFSAIQGGQIDLNQVQLQRPQYTIDFQPAG